MLDGQSLVESEKLYNHWLSIIQIAFDDITNQSKTNNLKVRVINQILDIVCLFANIHLISLDFCRQLQR